MAYRGHGSSDLEGAFIDLCNEVINDYDFSDLQSTISDGVMQEIEEIIAEKVKEGIDLYVRNLLRSLTPTDTGSTIHAPVPNIVLNEAELAQAEREE